MLIQRKQFIKNQIIQHYDLNLAIFISLGNSISIILSNTKNLHQLPIPPLYLMSLTFSFLSIIWLLIFYYKDSEISRFNLVIYLVTLVGGFNVILTLLFKESIIQLVLNPISNILLVIVFFELSLLISKSIDSEFPNSKVISIFLGSGLLSILSSEILVFLKISNISFFLLLIGNLLVALAIFIFSTISLMIPFIKNQRSIGIFLISLILPAFLALVVTNIIIQRELIVQIISLSVAQILGITSFRMIPGITFPVQSFFLMINISAILFGLIGLINLFTISQRKKPVLWLLVISLLGIDVTIPFINLVRVMAGYKLTNEVRNNI